jgi:chitinase
MRISVASLLASTLLTAPAGARFVIYADEYGSPQTPTVTILTISRWHPSRPSNANDRAGIDHVVLAFAMANATATYQPKVPITTIRSEFPNAKVMIAVGGWGDDAGFFQVLQTNTSMRQFASDIATMITNTGVDGVGKIIRSIFEFVLRC